MTHLTFPRESQCQYPAGVNQDSGFSQHFTQKQITFLSFYLSDFLTVALLFVWFLTELEQAQGKEGLGETERLLGEQEDASNVNQGETTGSAEGQI